MDKIIFDTSIYIPILRQGKMPGSIVDAPRSTIYLSSVVAQELYAGAMDIHTMRILDDLFHTFKKLDRIIVPNAFDWYRAGKILSKIGLHHGFESIKRGRLVNDVLIAIACLNTGATLLTSNRKDFKVIQEFLKFQFIGM